MAKSIPSPRRDDICGTPSFEIDGKVKDEILVAIGYDGSRLDLEQRRFLWDCGWHLEDIVPNFNPDDYADSPLFEIREDVNAPSEGEMTKEEREALGKQVDYDGSRLTSEQRRALFQSYWAMHLKMLGLRSPQHYGHKSRCLSLS